MHRKEQIQNNVLKKVLTEEHPFTVKKKKVKHCKEWTEINSGTESLRTAYLLGEHFLLMEIFGGFFCNHWQKIRKEDTKCMDEKDE